MSESLPADSGNLDTLTAEILILKRQTAASMIEIGQRLLRAKDLVGPGNFEAYLRDQVQFARSAAYKFMQAAKEFGGVQTFGHLDVSKVYLLLDAPREEREHLAEAASGMTARQLEEAVRETNRAKKEAEDAKRREDGMKRELADMGRRLEKAIQEATEAKNRPPKEVPRIEFQDSPQTKAQLDRLARELAEKNETIRLREADLTKLQRWLDEARKDLQRLQERTDRNAALEDEIRQKERQIKDLTELQRKMGATFHDGHRDPEGGEKLIRVLRPVADVILGTIGDVKILKQTGVGGPCPDEKVKELSERLKQLSAILDSILTDRVNRPIDITPTEV